MHEEAITKSLYDSSRCSIGDAKIAPMAKEVYEPFMQVLKKAFPNVKPAFHGTDARNHGSIFNRGLLIPGMGKGSDLSIVNGAVHGRGIYTANINAAWLSLGFCSAPRILVCAVVQSSKVTHPGDAMVVFDASHVIPVYELFLGSSYCIPRINLTVAAQQHIARAAAA